MDTLLLNNQLRRNRRCVSFWKRHVTVFRTGCLETATTCTVFRTKRPENGHDTSPFSDAVPEESVRYALNDEAYVNEIRMRMHEKRRQSEIDQPSTLNSQIGVQVAALLHEQRLTPAELARRSGIAGPAVYLMLNNRVQWLPKHLEAVARALGVPPRDLLPGPEAGQTVVLTARAVSDAELGPPVGFRQDAPSVVRPELGSRIPNPVGATDAALLEALHRGDLQRVLMIVALLAPTGASTSSSTTTAAPAPGQTAPPTPSPDRPPPRQAPPAAENSDGTKAETRRQLARLLDPKRG